MILKSAEILLSEVLHLIDQPERPAGSPRPEADIEKLRGKKVLLVEDNDVNQKSDCKNPRKIWSRSESRF